MQAKKSARKGGLFGRLKKLIPLFIALIIISLLTLFSIRHPDNRLLLDSPIPIEPHLSAIQPVSSELASQVTLEPIVVKRAVAVKQISYKGSCGTQGYIGGQCVYGVASWICVPQNMGSAYEWDDYARRNGYKVSSVPAVGTVAQSDKGGAGHVALVLAVKGDEIQIREMNFNYVPYSVRTRWVPVSSFEYIYF